MHTSGGSKTHASVFHVLSEHTGLNAEEDVNFETFASLLTTVRVQAFKCPTRWHAEG